MELDDNTSKCPVFHCQARVAEQLSKRTGNPLKIVCSKCTMKRSRLRQNATVPVGGMLVKTTTRNHKNKAPDGYSGSECTCDGAHEYEAIGRALEYAIFRGEVRVSNELTSLLYVITQKMRHDKRHEAFSARLTSTYAKALESGHRIMEREKMPFADEAREAIDTLFPGSSTPAVPVTVAIPVVHAIPAIPAIPAVPAPASSKKRRRGPSATVLPKRPRQIKTVVLQAPPSPELEEIPDIQYLQEDEEDEEEKEARERAARLLAEEVEAMAARRISPYMFETPIQALQ